MAITGLPGSAYVISWQECISDTIKLDYIVDGMVGPLIPIASAAPAHNDGDYDGHYDWTFPAGPYTNLHIRMQDTETTDVVGFIGPFTSRRLSLSGFGGLMVGIAISL